MRISHMATAGGFPVARSIPARVAAGVRQRRRISPQAGRALEILGHAIEYLTDQYVHRGGLISARDGELEAVKLLMALNRQIYFECPRVPSLAERFLALLHGRVT